MYLFFFFFSFEFPSLEVSPLYFKIIFPTRLPWSILLHSIEPLQHELCFLAMSLTVDFCSSHGCYTLEKDKALSFELYTCKYLCKLNWERVYVLHYLHYIWFFPTYKTFFQILWKSRCNILVSFPSHLKKLHSLLRFWLEKLNCGFFHSFHSRKNTTKQLFQSKFQCRK